MARVRDRDTRPERCVRSALWSRGIRYRLGLRVAGARPDILLRRAHVTIFIDGCFWHGCPIHYAQPRTKVRFWAAKLRENVSRDVRQTQTLVDNGFAVLRFWAHEIAEHPGEVVATIVAAASGALNPPLLASRWRVIQAERLDKHRERRHLVSLDGYQRIEQGRRNKNSYRSSSS